MEVNDGKGRIEPVPYLDLDEIHPIVRRWRRLLDEYGDRMMVAEAWVAAERRPLYLRHDEYHQAFDFDLLTAPWGAREFGAIISESVRSANDVGSNPTWVLSNHDVVRHATRYGLPRDVDPARWLLDGPHDLLDVERGARRARAAAMVTLALPGSAYVYQGDELGLPEAWNLPVDVLQDPIWHDSGHTVKGRDGCRVPVPWEPTGPSLGFGAGGAWLPQPPEYAALSAAVQDGDAARCSRCTEPRCVCDVSGSATRHTSSSSISATTCSRSGVAPGSSASPTWAMSRCRCPRALVCWCPRRCSTRSSLPTRRSG